MLLGAIAHREAGLHGVELISGMDLRHDQRHRRAMMNAVEGDLPNVDQDVLETSIDRGTPRIDDIRGHVHRQLERLQLHRQG